MNDKIIEEMARTLVDLKLEVDRLSKLSPLYEVLNPDGGVSLTADQNNWDIPDKDFLRPDPTANRTINGIDNGIHGRLLFVFNQSTTFTISFTHNNASADADNRITTPTSATIILGTRKTAIFMYAINTWLMLLPAA